MPASARSRSSSWLERPRSLPAIGLLGLTAVVGVGLGVLTAYAQGWLPDGARSLANSTGSWTLVAFALALVARDAVPAAAGGAVALLGLLGGYVLGAAIRDAPSSSSLIMFWGLAAVVAGPLLGLAAHWVRSGHDTLAAIGSGGVTGVLVSEGVYGLRFIAGTTAPAYWWGQIVVAVIALATLAGWRLRAARAIALAAAVAAVVGTVFVIVYSSDLISLL